MRRLLSVHDFTDISSILSAMHRLHFDHFMLRLKGQDRRGDGGKYDTTIYWYSQPLALVLEHLKTLYISIHLVYIDVP